MVILPSLIPGCLQPPSSLPQPSLFWTEKKRYLISGETEGNNTHKHPNLYLTYLAITPSPFFLLQSVNSSLIKKGF